MFRLGSQLLHSATDLVAFLDCPHRTVLDRRALDIHAERTEDDPHARLIQQKGIDHEKAYLADLRARYPRVVEIIDRKDTDRAVVLQRRLDETLAAMREGVDVVYQATLRDGNLVGHADFLRRVDGESALGAWHYEVIDTKLARSPQPKFVIQLAFYSRLLAAVQRVEPAYCHVVTGDARRTEHPFRVADAKHYVEHQLQRYLRQVEQPAETYPDPCAACDLCRWKDRCDEQRDVDDHPCRITGISRQQTRRLQAAGVGTMAAIAALPPGAAVPKVSSAVLERLRAQAALQHAARTDGQRRYELLPRNAEGRLGFHRLPPPDAHDLYFDMEGDPLEAGGLEYLFGVWGRGADPARPDEEGFRAFWAHNRAAERRAFEDFVDFVTSYVDAHPGAHVYHYASYERSAMERLMSWHGTREDEVDRIFKERRLVDLYAVVKGAIRISEPGYSIKNVERFYRDARDGGVTNAGQSVVWYEQWKTSREQQLLDDIEAYNRDDVESTRDLHRWLLQLRPNGLPWRETGAERAEAAAAPAKPPSDHVVAQRAARERLEARLPADRGAWTADHELLELAAQLLDFHRRCRKPEWWALFDRMGWDDEQLIEDLECLGGLERETGIAPVPVARSKLWTYRFPEQETKLTQGQGVTIASTGAPATIETLDPATGIVRIKYAANRGDLPDRIGLGPEGPMDSDAQEGAIRRFALSLLAGGGDYPAVETLLRRNRPRITGHPDGAPIIAPGREALPQIVDAIARLDRSTIFVQGPPGAGKTFTGAHVIVELLVRGHSVGVTSNSHKAIHNLLDKVEEVARERGIAFRGGKKSSKGFEDTEFNGPSFTNVTTNAGIVGGGFQLVAGTSWLFADPLMDRRLDYLFVDEAGQVALANLVATGTSATNIVLLGDQMQLGQPIQGVHPGRSGESTLEYLLDGIATIPSDRGIFLDRTYRMAPALCRFVSDAVYDGRLHHDACTTERRLVLAHDARPALKPAGLSFLPVPHDACSHRSEEEADAVAALLASLLKQRYRDGNGIEHVLALEDVLVVAPYNMQVRLLQSRLPKSTRVGTVDKFQGQEAQVVIVSMTTSSDEYLPRSKAFMYSRNRLNVAVSRGKCLAVVVASPGLLEAQCSNVSEIGLVNMLCGVAKSATRGTLESSSSDEPEIP